MTPGICEMAVRDERWVMMTYMARNLTGIIQLHIHIGCRLAIEDVCGHRRGIEVIHPLQASSGLASTKMSAAYTDDLLPKSSSMNLSRVLQTCFGDAESRRVIPQGICQPGYSKTS